MKLRPSVKLGIEQRSERNLEIIKTLEAAFIRLLLKNSQLYIGNFHPEAPSNDNKGMKKAIHTRVKISREEIRDFS